MSHLACPLCGKNAPLSTLDPSSLDLDLKLMSFRGLGRGKGFIVEEESSVLGDNDISPLIAERVLQLCKMFLESEVIIPEELIEELNLKPELLKSGDFIPRSQHESIVRSLKQEINLLQRSIQSQSISSSTRSYELEKLRKEKETEQKRQREVEGALGEIIVLCNPVLDLEDDTPFSLIIDEVGPDCFFALEKIFNNIDDESKKLLRRRLKTNDPEFKVVLDFLSKKIRRKTISEKLLEFNLGGINKLKRL